MTLIKRHRSVTGGLLLAVLVAAPVSADQSYYRWLDPQGNPVNSDRPPPPGTDYEIVTMKGSVSVSSDRSDSSGRALDTAPKADQPEDRAADSLPRMEVVKNPEACEAARKNLETLNSYARIRIPDGQGNYRFISEEEKNAEREKAQAVIDQNCE